MTISCSLSIDRTTKIQHLDNASWAQVKVLGNQLFQNTVANLASAKGINHDGHRSSYANSISQLYLCLVSQTSGHNVLCYITGCIGTGTVNLRWIFAGESTATMTSHTAIGINNNLTASKTAVPLWATDNKLTSWVDEILGFLAEKFSRNNSLDYILNHILANLLQSNAFIMLSRDNNSINSYRLAILIGNSNLSLAIWAEIWQCAILAHLSQTTSQTMCQSNWNRQILRSFVGSITKHHTLVTSTSSFFLIQIALASFQSLVNTLSNIWGLLVKGNKNTASICIKTELCSGITNLTNCISYDFSNIHIALGGYLASNMSLTSGNHSLTSYTTIWILGQNSIQNAIRNLICYFVRMSLSNRLRGKK